MAVAPNPQTLEIPPPAIVQDGVVIEMPGLKEKEDRLAEAGEVAGEDHRRHALPAARTHLQELLGEAFGWRRAIRTLRPTPDGGYQARTRTEELLGQAARLIDERKMKPPKPQVG